MLSYIATSMFKFISELLALLGSLLFYITPIVAIVAIAVFVQSNEISYLVLPLLSFVVGKLLLAISSITGEIATS